MEIKLRSRNGLFANPQGIFIHVEEMACEEPFVLTVAGDSGYIDDLKRILQQVRVICQLVRKRLRLLS